MSRMQEEQPAIYYMTGDKARLRRVPPPTALARLGGPWPLGGLSQASGSLHFSRTGCDHEYIAGGRGARFPAAVQLELRHVLS